MEKEFVPYDESLALKELGFDELCICIYNREKSLRVNVFNNPNDRFKSVRLSYNNGKIPAPLYQQAFRWLWNKTGKYIIPIQKDDKEWLAIGIVYKTYEEAELECLKKLIEIVKNK